MRERYAFLLIEIVSYVVLQLNFSKTAKRLNALVIPSTLNCFLHVIRTLLLRSIELSICCVTLRLMCVF